MENVIMKYREDLPPVLKGVTLNIKPNEKIGMRLPYLERVTQQLPNGRHLRTNRCRKEFYHTGDLPHG